MGLPTDGYFNIKLLEQDYGVIHSYRRLKEPHPNSDMTRVQFRPIGSEDAIVHHRQELWERPGTHYHHGLEPGDITLPAVLAKLLAEVLWEEDGRYVHERYVERYLALMRDPQGHRDTYIASAHRKFFRNLGQGLPLARCGETDSHIAGLLEAAPLLLAYCGVIPQVGQVVRQQIGLLRPNGSLAYCADLFGELLFLLGEGFSLEDAIYQKLGHLRHPFLAYPYHRWIAHQDDVAVATQHLGQGPLADDAIPLVFYLALKYADDFEKALEMNAMLGGDACHRGALIGMLLGAQNGCEGIPEYLPKGLRDFATLDRMGDRMWDVWNHNRELRRGAKR